MKTHAIFITGTDTGIGKTFVTMVLMKQLQALGYSVHGIKPIASGCFLDDSGHLVNEDALNLQILSSIKSSYSSINPIAFRRAIAPHLAAQEEMCPLTQQMVIDAISSSVAVDADFVLVEGCGGWTIPLNDHECYSQAITGLHMPVIMVVGMRLGCLNHALLTVDHLAQSGIPILGWVANVIDPSFEALDENIRTLERWIEAPRLATIPYHKGDMTDAITWHLDTVLNYTSCGNSSVAE